MSESLHKLLVVGTGTMGGGIAQAAAAAGLHVYLFDQADGGADGAVERIRESLQRASQKGYVTEPQAKATLNNLHPVTALSEAAADADLVIEAVKEDLEVKQSVFARLEALTSADTPYWTNTSMISITRIAEKLEHPQRLLGAHFFNPVPRMKLVEVIAGKHTAEAYVTLAEKTVTQWGKTPVRAPDTPGFLVNRILDAIKREALALMEEGNSPQRIDTAVRLGLNFPMGPLELMDLVGLDTTLDCLINQARAMGRPADFGTHLPALVAAGKHGRKTGSGFYAHVSQEIIRR